MNCSFSGLPVPTEKLFVLYYPPTAAHEKWDKSFYAAARAREALQEARNSLESFFTRYVLTRKIWVTLLVGVIGFGLLVYWGYVLATGWVHAGLLTRILLPIVALFFLLSFRKRMIALMGRLKAWKQIGKTSADFELAEIRQLMDELSDDPDAEDAAVFMRRECPEVLSEIAFQANNFRAFTYMDFVLSSKLKHPAEKLELPQQHSLYRDAYYVGETVFFSWHLFHKNKKIVLDPRFQGSGGKRGVI